MSEKKIKVIAVDGREFEILINKETTTEDVIIVFCKRLLIKPVTRHLFGLKFDENSWLSLNFKLWDWDKRLEARIRFRMPCIERLRDTDLKAFDYYFLQVRNDVLNNTIPDIKYEHKDEVLGLCVTDMYRVYLENDASIDQLVNDCKKYIPKEVFKHHRFFVKKPIFASLNDLVKSGVRDVTCIKSSYLQQFEDMTPNYLAEFFDASVEDKNVWKPIKICVNVYHKEMPGVQFAYKGIKGNNHLCSVEDICCVSLDSNGTAEISRKTGIPVYIRVESRNSLVSFITLLDGYYRLSVKWTFNLCKEFTTPTLLKLRNSKSHGPIGGTFSYSKLEQKRNKKPGCFILRECEFTYDTYYIDVCMPAKLIETYKIDYKGEKHFYFSGDDKTYESLQELIMKNRSPMSKIPLQECIPPSEYDNTNLLLCKVESVKPSTETFSDGSANIISFKHLQFYPGRIYPGKHNHTQVLKFLWRPNLEDKLDVALKVLKSNSQDKYLKTFLDLASNWSLLKSSAVVRLLGITLSPTVAMVTEFQSLGPLNLYLQKHKRDLEEVDLVEAATYIANAVWHMEGEGIVHGYLRCHKVLVSSHKDNSFSVRVADPGIHEYGDNDFHWIPPELYDNLDEVKKRTSADVWALGTTLWQLFSYGEEPELVNTDIKEYYSFGRRLPNPKGCSEDIYKLMLECWDHDPDQRKRPQAAMRDINQLLYQVYNSRRSHIYTIAKPKAKNGSVDTLNDVNSVTLDNESFSFSQASQVTASSYIDDSQDQNFDNQDSTSDISSFLSNLIVFQNSVIESSNSVQSVYSWNEDTAIKNVVLQGCIGKGCYGEVYKATAESVNSSSDVQRVAVKKLITNGPSSCTTDFMREINIMKSLKHPNIVEMKGVLLQPEILLIMEYVPHGSLKCYLSINKSNLIPEKHLLKYSLDVAKGMAYLGEKNIVHRDLAARNVLVASEYSVKISDFGLAQVIESSNYYILKTKRELPIRWFAPESISNGRFSTMSDVWSYGVLLYEMFSFGCDPVLENSNSAANDILLYNMLKNDIRLPKPQYCPNEVYTDLMHQCWKYYDRERPTFRAIIEIVKRFMSYYDGNTLM